MAPFLHDCQETKQSTMAPKTNDYKPYLVKMMNFIFEPVPPYTNATEFSPDQLSAVTAKDFMRYVNFKVYGVPEPAPDHTLAPSYAENIYSGLYEEGH
jgi:hypothetical protein